MTKLKWEYDKRADDLFIFKDENYRYDVSLNFDERSLVDFDTNGIPCAFEFFNASELFGFNKEVLDNIKEIKINIIIDSNMVKVNTMIIAIFKNKIISNSLCKIKFNRGDFLNQSLELFS